MPKTSNSADGGSVRLIAELDTMIELLNCDCMEYMATVPDKYFDLAIVDPPYGDFNGTIERTGGNWSKKHQRDGTIKEWDFAPKPEYFDEFLS